MNFTKIPTIAYCILALFCMTAPLASLASNIKTEHDCASLYLNSKYTQAFTPCTKQAQSHHADAQFYLGIMYFYGAGTKRNIQLGIKWLKKSAEQGYASAQFHLANFYFYGHGIRKNIIAARSWYEKSAQKKNVGAQFMLGYTYWKTRTTKNDQVACSWFLKASAQSKLSSDVKRRFPWLGGQIERYLGHCFYYGRGFQKNYPQALFWYLKAAKKNDGVSQYQVAKCYEFGFGTTSDMNKAIYWYEKAAKNGVYAAKRKINLLKNKRF